MKKRDELLDVFIGSVTNLNAVVLGQADNIYVSPFVYQAINAAHRLLPLTHDVDLKNCVINLLHSIYTDLRQDIKQRGVVVNGKKHPALDLSQQAYRIIVAWIKNPSLLPKQAGVLYCHVGYLVLTAKIPAHVNAPPARGKIGTFYKPKCRSPVCTNYNRHAIKAVF